MSIVTQMFQLYLNSRAVNNTYLLYIVYLNTYSHIYKVFLPICVSQNK